MDQFSENLPKARQLENLVVKARETAMSRLERKRSGGQDVLSNAQLEILVKAMDSLGMDIQKGELEPTRGKSILIVPLRELIDWGEPNESELMNRVYEIQKFYQENF